MSILSKTSFLQVLGTLKTDTTETYSRFTFHLCGSRDQCFGFWQLASETGRQTFHSVHSLTTQQHDPRLRTTGTPAICLRLWADGSTLVLMSRAVSQWRSGCDWVVSFWRGLYSIYLLPHPKVLKTKPAKWTEHDIPASKPSRSSQLKRRRQCFNVPSVPRIRSAQTLIDFLHGSGPALSRQPDLSRSFFSWHEV